jgi:hypothetical protein
MVDGIDVALMFFAAEMANLAAEQEAAGVIFLDD